MAREAIDVCLLMLKESNNGRFDSYRVRNSVLIISQITVRDCREHIFLLTFLEINIDTLARPAGWTLSRRENHAQHA